MKFLSVIAALISMLWFGVAGAQEAPRPLGIPLGSTKAEVRKLLGSTPMQEDGISKYTRSPMYIAPGVGLGMDGLKQVRLVFDKSDRLVFLLMTLDAGGSGKPAYQRVFRSLKSRYSLKSEDSPEPGHWMATFEAVDALVELEAPRQGADVTAAYITKEAYRAFMEIDRAEEAKQTDAARF